jgi:hypothetical protein
VSVCMCMCMCAVCVVIEFAVWAFLTSIHMMSFVIVEDAIWACFFNLVVRENSMRGLDSVPAVPSSHSTVQTVLTTCLDCGCARVRQCLQVFANCVHCLIRLVVWLCCVYSRGRGDTLYTFWLRLYLVFVLPFSSTFPFHMHDTREKNDLGTILRGFCCFIVFPSDLPVWLTKRISPLGALIDHITCRMTF